MSGNGTFLPAMAQLAEDRTANGRWLLLAFASVDKQFGHPHAVETRRIALRGVREAYAGGAGGEFFNANGLTYGVVQTWRKSLAIDSSSQMRYWCRSKTTAAYRGGPVAEIRISQSGSLAGGA